MSLGDSQASLAAEMAFDAAAIARKEEGEAEGDPEGEGEDEAALRCGPGSGSLDNMTHCWAAPSVPTRLGEAGGVRVDRSFQLLSLLSSTLA